MNILRSAAKSLLLYVLLLLSSLAHADYIKWRVPTDGGALEIGAAESRSWVDVNGDGRDDYCVFSGTDSRYVNCYIATATGFSKKDLYFQVPEMWGANPFRWVDVNGDGRVDLCRIDRKTSTAFLINCHLNNLPESNTFTSMVTLSVETPLTRCIEYSPINDTRCVKTEVAVGGVLYDFDFFFSDVNSDGSVDLCYIFNDVGPSSAGSLSGESVNKNIRCRFFNGSSFSSVTTNWISPNLDPGDRNFSRGFFDFNGDGFLDYCSVAPTNRLNCWITDAAGLSSAKLVTTGDMAHAYSASGAAFLDINGDGNTDFCAPISNYLNNIECVISNGRSWGATQKTLGSIHVGHEGYRWWIDVNQDGLVDYCRVPTDAPKHSFREKQPTYHLGYSGSADVVSRISCRLGQMGAESRIANDLTGMMTTSDIVFENVNIGFGIGGLSTCSANGDGVQTLCRITNALVDRGEVCTPQEEGGPICRWDYTDNFSLLVGLGEGVQAPGALLRSVSDGLSAQTRITYLPMSDARVYRRSGAGEAPRQMLVQGSGQVVYETRAWKVDDALNERDWEPLTGSARYFYSDLMMDRQNGARGFRERFMLTESSNTIDHTLFYQGRGPSIDATSRLNDPLEIGVPKLRTKYVINPSRVTPLTPSGGGIWSFRQRYLDGVMAQATEPVRDVWMGEGPAPRLLARSRLAAVADPVVNLTSEDGAFMLVQRTLNELDDTASPVGEVLPPGTPAANPRARFVGKSTTDAFDLNGTTSIRLPTTIATSKHNAFGNVWEQVQTTQQTGTSQGTLEWTKTTTSTYADDYTKWNLGRMTGSTVVSTAPTADKQLALFPRSAGTSPNATAISGTGPTPPPVPPAPLAPGVLSAILQLLLED